MTTPVQFASLEQAKLSAHPLHLAIGMFDGVHVGHRAVIEAAVHSARRTGGSAAVLTFWPHPSALFHPQNPTRLIQDGPAKARALRALGIEAIITEPFTRDFAKIAADDFLPWLKQRLPQLVAVYVGENFRFGCGRAGDVALLFATAPRAGVTIFSAPRVTLAAEPVSSTRVRQLLEAGDMEKANQLLGYVYFAEGIVRSGKRLGRTIGFPTLNVPWSPPLRPRLGVYAVRVSGPKSGVSPGVANYGVRPTVEQTNEPQLEIHVLGDCPFGEGDGITVEWLRFLRPETKFENLEQLRAQISRDCDSAAAYFALNA